MLINTKSRGQHKAITTCLVFVSNIGRFLGYTAGCGDEFLLETSHSLGYHTSFLTGSALELYPHKNCSDMLALVQDVIGSSF